MNKVQIQNLKRTAEEYRRKLQIGVPRKEQYSILEGAPFIVQVGAYTVGTDEEGRTKLENVNYPMQFTPKAKDQIVNECRFRDHNDNLVKPEVYGVKQWYTERLENIEMTLKLFSEE